MAVHKLNAQPHRVPTLGPAVLLAALAVTSLSSCASSMTGREPTRTSHSLVSVAGITRRIVVEHDRSIPAATALDLTERAMRLLANPDPSAAPAPCDTDNPYKNTWQTWSETVTKRRQLSADARLNGLRNDGDVVEVMLSSPTTSDVINFKFGTIAGDEDQWVLSCWEVDMEVIVT